MIFSMYAVFDRKAAVFARPFIVQNDGVARRAFESAKLDPNSEMSKWPDDFELFHVGLFDDESGTVTGVHPTVVKQEN